MTSISFKTILLPIFLVLLLTSGCSHAQERGGPPMQFTLSELLGFSKVSQELSGGCLQIINPGPSLTPVSVKFEGGNIGEKIIRFYSYLFEKGLLPCRHITFDGSAISPKAILAQENILPEGSAGSFEQVLCSLNDCSQHQRVSELRMVMPDSRIMPYWYTTEVQLIGDEELPRDLAKIVNRLEKNDDRKQLLAVTIEDLNQDRNFSLKKDNQTSIKRVIIVPRQGYLMELNIPLEYLEEDPGLLELVKQRIFSIQKEGPPDIQLKATIPTSEAMGSIDKQRRIISIPSNKPEDLTRKRPVIILADRGFKPDNIFLLPSTSSGGATPDIEKLSDTNACSPLPENHGTHLLGILRGRIPGYYNGWTDEMTIRLFDVTRKIEIKPNVPSATGNPKEVDLVLFITDPYHKSNVVNFSIDVIESKSQLTKKSVEEDWRGMIENSQNSTLYVVAAGNGDNEKEGNGTPFTNTSSLPLPMSFHDSRNVITVAALNGTGDQLWGLSNRNGKGEKGEKGEVDIVHIAAPGDAIISTCRNDRIGILSGTSQAAAFVTGAASLLVRETIGDPGKVKNRLLYTADLLPTLSDSVSSGRLNVSRALESNLDKLCIGECGDRKYLKGQIELYDGVAPMGEGSVVTLYLPGKQVPVIGSNIVRIFKHKAENFTVFYLGQSDGKLYKKDGVRKFIPENLSFWDKQWQFLAPDPVKEPIHYTSVYDFVKRIE